MKMRIHATKRKAISPVLATVILIAITLIAAIAVAGFVFGLFGSFTSSAQVSGAVTSCTPGVNSQICVVNLTNTGTSSASVTGCALQLSGASTTGVPTPASQKIVAGGAATAVTCTVTSTAAQTSGSQAVGSFTLSNGGTVTFSGTWA